MDVDVVGSPTRFLSSVLGELPLAEELGDWESHWRWHGQAVSDAVDRAGTPHLRMFDAVGGRVDEILYPPDYWRLLAEGYRRGVVWRAFAEGSPIPFLLFGYVTSFFDTGLFCPYTVSMSTAVALDKYGSPELKTRFLTPLLRADGAHWQGATWMTEALGGSDLGAGVDTTAREVGPGAWRLTGDKYFCSNVGAEVAVVAARPQGAPPGVRGLSLFLVPRDAHDGSANYRVRRLKDKIATRSVPTGEVELRDSEGWLLGAREAGIYLILEVLNVSRVANSVGAVALVERALADVVDFAAARVVFGRPVGEHPLMARQIADRTTRLREAFALAWDAALRLERVWAERPRYSPAYHAFRLAAHLAKYWTAECAVQTAKWALEAFGGAGTLAENRVERWLREAMILAIWEGAPHRQILDGLEAIERYQAHLPLLEGVRGLVADGEIAAWRERVAALVALPRDAREAQAEPLFADLAGFLARALATRVPGDDAFA